MSHETESPPGEPRADADAPLPFQRELTEPPPPTSTTAPNASGHVMSPGTHFRPQTMVGIGSIPPPKDSVPPAPLTEVEAAPAVRKDVAMAGVDPAGTPRPRPSETMVGATSPLHTAEDANTAVNLSSLSPADAGRIIAAAEADGRAPPRRTLTLPAPAAAFPPPPGLRRSIPLPPPSTHYAPTSMRGRIGGTPVTLSPQPPPAARSPQPPPPARSPRPPPSTGPSYALPPSRRPNTLLLYGSMDDASASPPGAPAPVASAAPAAPLAGDGRSIRAALGRLTPGDLTKPMRSPTMRAGPPPPAEDGVEELSPALLADDSGEIGALGPARAQQISSSSLIDDPDSSPELLDDEAPPIAATAASPVRLPIDPPSSPFYPAASGSPAMGVAVPEEPLVSPDPFGRATEPPKRRDQPPTDPPSFPVQPLPPLPRPVWLLPAMIAGGVAMGALVLGGIVLALRSGPSTDKPGVPVPSPSSVASHPATTAPSPDVLRHPAALTSPAESTAGSACVLAGAPHTVAPHALLKTGIETASNDDRLALGVGLTEHEGFVVALDPSTFAVVNTVRPHSTELLHRVVPILSPELGSFLETNHKKAPIESAYPVLADPPFVLGVAHGKLVWAVSRTSTPVQLWSVDGAPVEALRAVALPGHAGYAIAFRQGASIYLGALKEDKTINGELARIGSLGPQLGAPTLAAGTDHVVVAWADRTSPAVPWGVRWVKWRPGTEPGEPTAFPLQSSADGAAAMAPSITSLTGGRFVIAWTEALGAQHVVKAQALDGSERPIGTTLTLSGDGVNAGEGMPVFTRDGRGAIVFLATPTGATASVVAVPVICPN